MRSLSSLNKYFFRYKKRLLLGFIFILISNVTSIYIPLFLKSVIDGLSEDISSEAIAEYAVYIIVFAIVSGIFRFLIRQTIIVVSREIEYDLRHDFWAHIQKLPLRYFQNNSTGNIMAHATNDINAVRMYVGPAVMYSCDTLVIFFIVIGIIISISPALTFYTLIPLPLLSYFVYKLSKKIHKKFMKIQEKFSELTTKAQENFSGIRVIKSYVRETNQVEAFTKLSREYLERNMDKVKIQALFMPIMYIIIGLSIIILIIGGGSMVISGELTFGDITAFMVYLGYLIWPMIAFGWVMNIIQQASASMKRINKILTEDEVIKDTDKTRYSINSIRGAVSFENVTFRYKENLPDVLKNININIPKGDTIAIVGHTGVGKTSLINLIPRLYDAVNGKVKIDGIDVKEIPLKILRQNIGLVSQETFLFSDTLENNLLYGAKNRSHELVKKVAEISHLNRDVVEFPDKYDTVLGERGITLSGGQKQRACLARALAVDPKILILDDSFSAVDTNTEEEILSALKDFMKGRTSIIISHRISTVKNADKIYVLDEGAVAEEGTHEELVKLGGIYSELHHKQLLEEELKEMS